jgi:hypothetical protein
MKKLFVSMLAIAALVSCSKDNEDILLQSSKKSVAITISNAVPQTKAVPEVTPTANGGVATIQSNRSGLVTEVPLPLHISRESSQYREDASIP